MTFCQLCFWGGLVLASASGVVMAVCTFLINRESEQEELARLYVSELNQAYNPRKGA